MSIYYLLLPWKYNFLPNLFTARRGVIYNLYPTIKDINFNNGMLSIFFIINTDFYLLVLQDLFVAEGEGYLVMENIFIKYWPQNLCMT